MGRREVDPDFYCPQAALIDEETNLRTERRLARYRGKVEAARKRQAQEATAATMASQQRQRLWMAGGALAIAALSLHWYKRHSRRGRRRWGGVGDPPRDLALDDDDGFDEPDEELRRVFDEAAKLARSIPGGVALDQRDRLMLYGLYKQSTEGDRNERDTPSNLNVVAFAKYDAWGKFKGLPKQFAMRKVICIFSIRRIGCRSAPY
jgi:acyl-CoA-binding protein